MEVFWKYKMLHSYGMVSFFIAQLIWEVALIYIFQLF